MQVASICKRCSRPSPDENPAISIFPRSRWLFAGHSAAAPQSRLMRQQTQRLLVCNVRMCKQKISHQANLKSCVPSILAIYAPKQVARNAVKLKNTTRVLISAVSLSSVRSSKEGLQIYPVFACPLQTAERLSVFIRCKRIGVIGWNKQRVQGRNGAWCIREVDFHPRA